MTQELSADYADYTDWRKTTTNKKGRQTKWRPHSLICEICVICGLVFRLIFFGDANPSFVPRLLHDLLGELSRNGIIVRELHMKRSARSGDRIQRRLIVEHLGHRHLRLDQLVLAPGVHALHA